MIVIELKKRLQVKIKKEPHLDSCIPPQTERLVASNAKF